MDSSPSSFLLCSENENTSAFYMIKVERVKRDFATMITGVLLSNHESLISPNGMDNGCMLNIGLCVLAVIFFVGEIDIFKLNNITGGQTFSGLIVNFFSKNLSLIPHCTCAVNCSSS